MRHLRRALVVLAVLLVVGAAGLVFWLRASLPEVEGTVRTAGLAGAVTVARDAHGVPRIIAASQADAYFALGFVHAQDRLWQMEMQRRAGAGRLSELFGEAALGSDRFMRTLGLYRLAEASLDHLDPEVLAALDAYAAGVNAWAAQDHTLPPEFLLLRHRPEPWRPADSLVWGRLMGMQLSGNWRDELLRARLAERLPTERIEALWPPYPADAPTTTALDRDAENLHHGPASFSPSPGAASGRLAAASMAAGHDAELLHHALDGQTASALLAALPDILRPRLASNVWALSGSHTASGKPLLANDPHLGLQAPILWYLAAIEAPGLMVHGATVPGVPFHLLGHNGRIAWGVTTTHSDTMDLFIEREAGQGSYETPDGARPFRVRNEIIKVKDGADVALTVRETRHGPVISDVLPRPGGAILALASPVLEPDDRTAQAFYHLNRATDWPSFLAALGDFHSPQQNLVYAGADGVIGFLAPGRVPIRRAGDGTVPRPGWSGEFDWRGWVPYEELPRSVSPASGRIVNANNRIVDDGYPYLIAAHWPEPYRAQRIEEMLSAAPKHDAAAMAAMQLDVVSPPARALVRRLPGLPWRDERPRAAARRLTAWDGAMRPDRPEPMLFEAWLLELSRTLLANGIGESAADFRLARPLFVETALAQDEAVWCDTPATPTAESCADALAGSFERALDAVERRHGADMGAWRWGDVHRAVFDHALLTRLPLIGALGRIAVANGGSDHTVNRGTYGADGADPFRQEHGPGFRAVYDLADLSASRFIVATGQSGNPLSPHWRDLVHDWRDGRYIAIGRKPAAATLRLEPPR